MNEQQLVFHYQPIICTLDQTPVGYEVLTRRAIVNELGRTLQLPHQFMNNYSKHDFFKLDTIVSKLAIALAKDYEQVFFINVSASVSLSYEKLAKLLQILEAIPQFIRERLVFEISENNQFHNISEAFRIMDSLRNLGFRLAIDDYGSGSSSPLRLVSYPYDIIKLDKSITQQLGTKNEGRAMSFINGLLNFCNTENSKLIVEGIESETQHNAAIECGVELAQGFYYASPSPMSFSEKVVVGQ